MSDTNMTADAITGVIVLILMVYVISITDCTVGTRKECLQWQEVDTGELRCREDWIQLGPKASTCHPVIERQCISGQIVDTETGKVLSTF